MGVEHDAEQRPASGSLGAIGQKGIVGENRTDASEDGVGGVAKALNLVAGSRSCNPVRLVGETSCGGRSKLAIGGERSLQGDEGLPCPDEVREGLVEIASLVLEHADDDLDTRGA